MGVGSEPGAEGERDDSIESGDGRGGGGPPGSIRSRGDVVRVIDAICAYYRDREPSSPVPVLLTRAKRLVNLSYLEIVRDLTPAAVSEAAIFAGVEKTDT